MCCCCHKLPSILSLPKTLLPTIFQFACIDSKFWKVYLSRLCMKHKWLFEEGMGYASPKILIRFSDNPWQKETIDSIICLRRIKCVIHRLDIIFNVAHMTQLIVSKINFFCQRDICRYPYRDIRRKIPNFTPCQEVEQWQWLVVSMWHLVEMSGENAVYAYINA